MVRSTNSLAMLWIERQSVLELPPCKHLLLEHNTAHRCVRHGASSDITSLCIEPRWMCIHHTGNAAPHIAGACSKAVGSIAPARANCEPAASLWTIMRGADTTAGGTLWGATPARISNVQQKKALPWIGNSNRCTRSWEKLGFGVQGAQINHFPGNKQTRIGTQGAHLGLGTELGSQTHGTQISQVKLGFGMRHCRC